MDEGVIELVGSDNRRSIGTVGAIAGGLFSAMGLSMSRGVPMPAKLVSLVFAGVGAGVSVLASAYGRTENWITVRRGEGIRFRVTTPGAEPKEWLVASEEIDDFEVIKQIVETTDDYRTTRRVDWRIDMIAKSGRWKLVIVRSEEDGFAQVKQIRAALAV